MWGGGPKHRVVILCDGSQTEQLKNFQISKLLFHKIATRKIANHRNWNLKKMAQVHKLLPVKNC
jgi:hypothetical protein